MRIQPIYNLKPTQPDTRLFNLQNANFPLDRIGSPTPVRGERYDRLRIRLRIPRSISDRIVPGSGDHLDSRCELWIYSHFPIAERGTNRIHRVD